MRHSIHMIAAFLMIGLLPTLTARGQAAPGGFDQQAFEEQAKQLLAQMRDPNADQQQIGQQMRDLMQQFRDATANLPPDQADKMRQDMMQRLQPEIVKSMPSIIRRMQQGIMDRLRQDLDCSDEEFSALKPKLQSVLDAMQAATIAGRRPGFGGGFNLPGQSQSLSQALRELRATLDDTEAKPDAIKTRLEAVRQARQAAERDLAVARAELRPLLTVRQEAVLAVNGMLD